MDMLDSRSRLQAALACEELDLVETSLAIAADEYPDLDEPAVGQALDALAGEVRESLVHARALPRQLSALAHVLGARHGFCGNTRAYADPRNSFLHEVLTRKAGIPISLALLYQVVSHRAGIALHGVAFPGHFLVGAGAGPERVILDPFQGGTRLLDADLRRLLARTAPGMTFSPQLLRPATSRQITFRMLTNLKHIYLAAEDWPRALRIVELLLVVAPEHPGELRVRASILQSLGAYDAALRDLQHCLALSPDAPDVIALRWTAQTLASRAGWRS